MSKAHRYEPDVNPTYQDFATHYGLAVIPARVRKPRDKAKAEGGVLLVERWILARLRQRTWIGLAELNTAITEALIALNARPFRTLAGSRRSLFQTIDQPALRPLPRHLFEYAEWSAVRVPPHLHVTVDGHAYSVPHALVKRRLDVRLTAATVEVFHRGQRVACHVRRHQRDGYTTVREHLPEAHRQYLDWTPARLRDWAAITGPHTAGVIAHRLKSRPHVLQALQSGLGIVRLGQSYGADRLEAACTRALASGAISYRSLASILDHGLDRQPWAPPPDPLTPITHTNLRGAHYFH